MKRRSLILLLCALAIPLMAGDVVIVDGSRARRHVHCETLYAPNELIAVANINSIWRAPANVTFTNVWCESPVGTVTVDLERDSGSAADITTAALVCASTPVDACASGCTTTLVAAEDNLADGDRLDLNMTAVASSPTTLNICWEYRFD